MKPHWGAAFDFYNSLYGSYRYRLLTVPATEGGMSFNPVESVLFQVDIGSDPKDLYYQIQYIIYHEDGSREKSTLIKWDRKRATGEITKSSPFYYNMSWMDDDDDGYWVVESQPYYSGGASQWPTTVISTLMDNLYFIVGEQATGGGGYDDDD